MVLPLINVLEAEELTLATFQLADLTGEKELQLKSCLKHSTNLLSIWPFKVQFVLIHPGGWLFLSHLDTLDRICNYACSANL